MTTLSRVSNPTGLGWMAYSAGIVMLTLTTALTAQQQAPESLQEFARIQQQIQAALESVREATVNIDRGGSGVIVSEDGLVLTAAHVSERPGRDVTIRLTDGRRLDGVALGAFLLADAGMVRITEPGPWPFAKLSSPNSSQVGHWCFALGHPGGFDAERGLVLRLGRVISKAKNFIRTDCKLLGGDSGGPLFNLAGEVIGIHSRISQEVDENFHAPIEAFDQHWDRMAASEQFPSTSRPPYALLGVNTDVHAEGVIVTDVVMDSAASEAGILVGDVILEADGFGIDFTEELRVVIRGNRPGDVVDIRLKRDDREQVVSATLRKIPKEDKDQ